MVEGDEKQGRVLTFMVINFICVGFSSSLNVFYGIKPLCQFSPTFIYSVILSFSLSMYKRML